MGTVGSMIIGAVVAAGLAVLVGTLLLADLPPGTSLGGAMPAHVGVALGATAIVCVAAVGGSDALEWVSVVALLGAVGLGYRLYRRATTAGAKGSPALLVVHGAAAATAVALALAAAIVALSS